MRLDAYLDFVDEKPSGFARRIGINPSMVHRYTKKNTVPRPDIMARIVLATSGRVRPDDFYTVSHRSKKRRRAAAS